MKRLRLLLILIIILLSSCRPAVPPLPATIDRPWPSRRDFVSGLILVKFRSDATAKGIDQVHRSLGGQAERRIEALGIDVVSFTVAGEVDPWLATLETVARYTASTIVEWAEPDYLAYADAIPLALVPNDPSYSGQWHLPKISAPAAWDLTTGAGVIAVLDTGLDAAHADFAGRVLPGWDFVNGDANPADDQGHGTMVAGAAAAKGNNGVAVAGVCWNCQILPVKVLNSSGSGTYDAIAQGIVWAADHGARVINLSLGGSSSAQTLQEAVNYAWGKGVLLVAAAGNSATSTPMYPAGYANVLAVAASDQNDRLASFSNWGTGKVSAPGVGIYTTARGGGVSSASGTSLACPLVSGEAGLLLGRNPGLTAAQLRTAIETQVDPGNDSRVRGRVNVYKAVVAVGPIPSPTPSPVGSWTPTATPRPSATVQPTPVDVEQQVLVLINQNRASAGLAALTMEGHLVVAARRQSADMAANNFCGHTGSDGSTPGSRIVDAGYPYAGLGETVACGYPTAEAAVVAWMGSPGHKAILLDAGARDIGVGYAEGGTYGYLWTCTTGTGGGPVPTATPTVVPTATRTPVPPPTPAATPTGTPMATRTPAPGQYCLRCLKTASGPDDCYVIPCP